jgi:hypothetical protein
MQSPFPRLLACDKNHRPAQAAQPTEKARFGRENPSKSKTIQPHQQVSSARIGHEPRKPKRIEWTKGANRRQSGEMQEI